MEVKYNEATINRPEGERPIDAAIFYASHHMESQRACG